MSDKFTTDVIRKVWDDTAGTAYTVRPDADGLNLVQLDSEEIGSFMIFYPSQAKLVAEALLVCAAEIEATQ